MESATGLLYINVGHDRRGDDPGGGAVLRRRAAAVRRSSMSVLPPLRIRVRLFAMQRETAGMRELRLEVPLGATVDDAWDAVVEVGPRPRARAARRSGSRSTASTRTRTGRSPTATSSRASRRSAAGRTRQDAGRARGGSSRSARRRSPPASRRSSPTGSRRTRTAAWWRSSAGRGSRRARRRRARRRRPPATPGATSRAWPTRRSSRWRSRVLGEIADEIEARFGVRRAGDRPPDRRGAAGRGVGASWSPWRPTATPAFAAARYAIDETKARAPIWKAERFADGHVWIGDVARTGPARTPRAGSPTGAPA